MQKSRGLTISAYSSARLLQFAPQSESGKIDIYTIVGRRNDSSTKQPVTNIAQASPTLFTDTSDSIGLRADVKITKVDVSGAAPPDTGGVAVLTSFGDVANSVSGNISASLFNVPGTTRGNDLSAFTTGVNSLAAANAVNGSVDYLLARRRSRQRAGA